MGTDRRQILTPDLGGAPAAVRTSGSPMRGTTYLDLNLELRYVDTRGVRTGKTSDKIIGPTVESELLDDRPEAGPSDSVCPFHYRS